MFLKILNRLGSVYVERIELEKAESYFARALKIRENKLGQNHSRVAQSLKHLLTLYELQENFVKACECGQKALKIVEKLKGEESIETANVLLRLGGFYFAMDGHKSIEGKQILMRAIAIKEKKLGKEHVQCSEAEKLLDELSNPPPPAVPLPPPPPPPPSAPPISAPSTPALKPGEIPRPPPPPSFAVLKPRPTVAMDELMQELTQGKQLKQQVITKRKAAQDAAQGWWKQNYKYKSEKPSRNDDDLDLNRKISKLIIHQK